MGRLVRILTVTALMPGLGCSAFAVRGKTNLWNEPQACTESLAPPVIDFALAAPAVVLAALLPGEGYDSDGGHHDDTATRVGIGVVGGVFLISGTLGAVSVSSCRSARQKARPAPLGAAPR